MKKVLISIFLLILFVSLGFASLRFEPVFRQRVLKKMTVKEFLYDKNSNHWNELYLNKDKNVEYKGMVIIKDNNHEPINSKTAYWDNELIMYFRAEGIRPEEWGCDLSDKVKNGTLGCYLFPPDETTP